MNDDIKIGDICEVINSEPEWNGLLVTVVEPLMRTQVVPLFTQGPPRVIDAYGVRFDGVSCVMYAERDQLRKIPPKGTCDESPRANFTPAIADDWSSIGWTPGKTRVTQ